MKQMKTKNLWLGCFKVAGLALLTCIIAIPSTSTPKASNVTVVKGQSDRMTIDDENHQLYVTATVTKDCSKPSVCDWGRRGQAFFGSKGGKAEPFFIFTTDVNRTEIDKAMQRIGIKAKRQLLDKSEVDKRTGLKSTTAKDDYLDGNPIMVVVRHSRGNETVETAIEEFIEEKSSVDGKEVVKPYTPHFVYHGSGEAINYPSGIVCPSGCYGGIIADNSVPLLTTTSFFRLNWEKMPGPGSKVQLVLKSVYGKSQWASK